MAVVSAGGLIVPHPAQPSEPTIETVAGGLTEGVGTEIGQWPFDLFWDGTSLLVADGGRKVLRALDPATLDEKVVAGVGIWGAAREGNALSSPFTSVGYVARNGSGEYYVSSRWQIFRVDPAGNMAAVAGGGQESPSDGVRARDAELSPGALVVDPDGNLLFVDKGTSSIYRLEGGDLHRVAGTGTAGDGPDFVPATMSALGTPAGLAVGPQGLFISDTATDKVRLVDRTGSIRTFAGSGGPTPTLDDSPAAATSLNDPTDLDVDAVGNVYVADTGQHRVLRSDPLGIRMETIAGNGGRGFSGDGGPAVQASFDTPRGVAVTPAGDVFIADTMNRRVRRVDLLGRVDTVAGNGTMAFAGDGGPAAGAQLYGPGGVVVDDAGRLLINDHENQRVRIVGTDGSIGTIAVTGPAEAEAISFGPLPGIALDGNGGIYFSDRRRRVIHHLAPDGTLQTVVSADSHYWCRVYGAPSAAFLPSGLVVDDAGRLYYSDPFSGYICRRDLDGTVERIAGRGGRGFDGDGGPASDALLDNPNGLSLDLAGNLYVADAGNNRIRKIDAEGIISTVAGTGESWSEQEDGPATEIALNRPQGIAAAPDGTLYVADTGNRKVRMMSVTGMMTTIAGTGGTGFTGDGGLATSAEFLGIRSVALGPDGALYVSGDSSHRVRRIH